jgi:hypothetical protein
VSFRAGTTATTSTSLSHERLYELGDGISFCCALDRSAASRRTATTASGAGYSQASISADAAPALSLETLEGHGSRCLGHLQQHGVRLGVALLLLLLAALHQVEQSSDLLCARSGPRITPLHGHRLGSAGSHRWRLLPSL